MVPTRQLVETQHRLHCHLVMAELLLQQQPQPQPQLQEHRRLRQEHLYPSSSHLQAVRAAAAAADLRCLTCRLA